MGFRHLMAVATSSRDGQIIGGHGSHTSCFRRAAHLHGASNFERRRIISSFVTSTESVQSVPKSRCQSNLPLREPSLSSKNCISCVSKFKGSYGQMFQARNASGIHLSLRGAEEVEVLVNQESINRDILSKTNILKEPYRRPFYLSNCHVETIFAAYFRTLPMVQYRRECLRMADGGTVALDFPVGGEDADLWTTDLRDDAPVLILLPGLTGGSGDTYVRHMILRARRAGWRPVVFNSRGCADSPVTTPQFYSASFTEDLRQVVKYVANRFLNSRVYAAGWSLGANILVRYIAQEGENCVLSGAISMCNPFDLVLADKNFHVGFNNVYDKSLASSLKKIFKKHAKLFEAIGGEYDVQKAANSKTVRDFDDGITRVSFGFKTVDEYYDLSSSSRSIKDVRIPLLCIQAEDDPIAPSAGIPRADIAANKNCALVVTPAGGHLGWIAGGTAPLGAPWTDPLAMEYLELLDSLLSSGAGERKREREAGDAKLVSVVTMGPQQGVPEAEEAVIR
ncbi:hypothetical protein R1sor_000040 [Riccia sorocarpa]|uniref:AB hydrolase-1 domain-containing protein n=1 Tax=Riccia sorocarpa TaxID=122646 RepID=A0ABD3GS80_9MARC